MAGVPPPPAPPVPVLPPEPGPAAPPSPQPAAADSRATRAIRTVTPPCYQRTSTGMEVQEFFCACWPSTRVMVSPQNGTNLDQGTHRERLLHLDRRERRAVAGEGCCRKTVSDWRRPLGVPVRPG